jgi:hypothetical protein
MCSKACASCKDCTGSANAEGMDPAILHRQRQMQIDLMRQ